MTMAFDTVVALGAGGGMQVNRWEPLGISTIASAEAFDGNTNTATATIKIENLVEVRDHLGINVIPILKVCTASGTQY